MDANSNQNIKAESLSLGLNQLLMFICVLFLGWKLTELMTLLGVELFVSGLLWYYVDWYWGLQLKKNRQKGDLNKLILRVFFQIMALILSVYIIYCSAEIENSNLLTVEMGLFALFFACMPFAILMIWQKRGYIPTIELLPAQLRILLSRWQLIINPLLCGIGFATLALNIAVWQGAALICGLKLLFDLYLYKKSNV